jgi:DNA-binding NarL/FixJ family response regulator
MVLLFSCGVPSLLHHLSDRSEVPGGGPSLSGRRFRNNAGNHREICARHPEVEIVGQSADFKETLDLTAELRPDVLLMDLRMAERVNGQTKKLKEGSSSLRIVVMSASDDDENVQQITRRIAADKFVDKMYLYEKLIPAILQTEIGAERRVPRMP